MSSQSKFSGVWCPSVTPFDRQGRIDFAALNQHFSRLKASGIDALLLMGSIGEFASLSQQERLLLLREARTMSTLPMVANISGTCITDML